MLTEVFESVQGIAMFRLCFFICGIALCNPALASDIYSLKVCEPIQDSSERLACYDAAMQAITGSNFNRDSQAKPEGSEKQRLPVNKNGHAEKRGAWTITDDRLDNLGKRYWLAYTQSNSYLTIEYGKQIRPELFLRCKDRRFDAYIIWQTYIGEGSTFAITKVGNKQPSTEEWYLSSSGDAIFYPRDKAGLFLHRMIGSDELRSVVTPLNSDPLTAVFNIKGVADVARHMRGKCSFKGEPGITEMLGM